MKVVVIAGTRVRRPRRPDSRISVSTRPAVAGDAVGANMTAALTTMAEQRGDVAFVPRSLSYAVTDGAQHTASCRGFADGRGRGRPSET